ncbi:MAG: YggS family pyridoxal phosphate-dependent enzyme [Hyphomicrobiales bacterium]
MSDVDKRLLSVLDTIKAESSGEKEVTLIAVSKTFEGDHIEPALVAGHRHFGENRVQESQKKWPSLKQKYPNTRLHLIGPLQSNKAADAVELFDVIHTVDREKIAKNLASEMKKQDRILDVYIQVNTGQEPQKAGVLPKEADAFIARCIEHHGLNVVGLMCIPPFDANPEPHFQLLSEMASKHGLEELSMGMSCDYQQAIKAGATCVRVGSAIFGSRAKQ